MGAGKIYGVKWQASLGLCLINLLMTADKTNHPNLIPTRLKEKKNVRGFSCTLQRAKQVSGAAGYHHYFFSVNFSRFLKFGLHSLAFAYLSTIWRLHGT